MKKEEGKINLLMLVMVPILIGVGVLVGYYVSTNNLVAESDLPNSSTNVSVAEVPEESTENSKIDRIEGVFFADIEGPNDSSYYVFHLDGTVSCEGNYITKGTYTIENNTIKIKYSTIEGPGTDGEEKTDGEEELKLIDENTIDGYIKFDVKKHLVGKWIFKEAYDENNEQANPFGSIAGKYGVGDITFNEDGSYTNYVGAFSSENEDDTEGTYDISGNEITLKAKSGKKETLDYYTSGQICYRYGNYYLWLVRSDSSENNANNTSNTNTLNNTTSSSVASDSEKTYYEGYEVKGTIEIPNTGVNDVVLESVTKHSMENGFCISYGPGLNEDGNTTLFVHGIRLYKNNNRIKNGDKIIIKDQSGRKYTYEVYDIHDINDDDASYMLRNTGGNVEISIQTGADTDDKRRVIFAKKI